MQAVNQASTGDPGQTTMLLNDRLPPMRVRPLRALRAFPKPHGRQGRHRSGV